MGIHHESAQEVAYVPYDLARRQIQKVVDDMRAMKLRYLSAVEELDDNYKQIEEEIRVASSCGFLRCAQMYMKG